MDPKICVPAVIFINAFKIANFAKSKDSGYILGKQYPKQLGFYSKTIDDKTCLDHFHDKDTRL